jgi:hypothetical protein
VSKRVGIIFLLVALLGAQAINRWCLRGYRSTVADLELEVLSSGERVAAAVLGGFRSFLVTILWVRAFKLQETKDFGQLLLYFQALQELQGSSPGLFRHQAYAMALDIPRVLDDGDERWDWIGRGLRALEMGLSRYPHDRDLLECAATIFERRFHVGLNPEDRARYLADSEINPTRDDPLDRAIEYFDELHEDPEHSPVTCKRLIFALFDRLDLALKSPVRVEASIRKRAKTDLERVRKLVDHLVVDHGADASHRAGVDADLVKYGSRVQALQMR